MLNKDPLEKLTPQAVLQTLPPFPVVLVTTRSNIITIDQLTYFTMSPLRIGIGVAHARHTHGLLQEEGEFVINVPDASLLGAVKICGRMSGRDKDKFYEAGLTREDSTEVAAAGIAECGASIECRVEQQLPFEDRTWFIGKVVAATRHPEQRGSHALLCGRVAYWLPGEMLQPR
jgi:flavin reductase (DIM6/NTAB) family NADH-FMN oxidoreductase RutF